MNDKPKYNPQIHHRRSIRLKGYDYSRAGLYFITICCDGRKCCFGEVKNNTMILNEFGNIAYNEWVKLAERFAKFELDVFQIMPNHMHGIILLNEFGVGSTLAVDRNTNTQNDGNEIFENKNGGTQNGQPINGQPQGLPQHDGNGTVTNTTIGDMVGAYKSLVANGCLEIYKSKNEMMGKLWQRNYYEHIIRNEQAYQNISNYIINNPVKWDEDKFHHK
jgi:putative transposase